MNIAIIGSRSLNVEDIRDFIFDLLTKGKDRISCIVSGGAEGPDRFAEEWIYATGGKYVLFRPEYSKYGKGATFKRNDLIIEASDVVLGLWDGKSKGSKYTIDRAIEKGKKVVVYRFDINTEHDEDGNSVKTAKLAEKIKHNYE